MPPAGVSPTDHLARIVEAVSFNLGKEDFRIFLFGPGLKPDEIVSEPLATESTFQHAKFLRYFIAKTLREHGWVIDFGESPEIETMWTKFHAPIDAGRMEYEHALAVCGAVVILPSSPGSFCEMGLFAGSKDISTKTLAVVHSEYEEDPSFFRRGLIRVFQARGGNTKYKHYNNKESVLNAVREFIEDRFNSIIWDKRDIHTGKRRQMEQEAATG